MVVCLNYVTDNVYYLRPAVETKPVCLRWIHLASICLDAVCSTWTYLQKWWWVFSRCVLCILCQHTIGTLWRKSCIYAHRRMIFSFEPPCTRPPSLLCKHNSSIFDCFFYLWDLLRSSASFIHSPLLSQHFHYHPMVNFHLATGGREKSQWLEAEQSSMSPPNHGGSLGWQAILCTVCSSLLCFHSGGSHGQ